MSSGTFHGSVGFLLVFSADLSVARHAKRPPRLHVVEGQRSQCV